MPNTKKKLTNKQHRNNNYNILAYFRKNNKMDDFKSTLDGGQQQK